MKAPSAAECEIDYFDPKKIRHLERYFRKPDRTTALADIFKTLADPTRVRIVMALAEIELCVCDLASFLKLSKSAVSHQLRLLRDRRVVKYRREGKMSYYSLDDEHIRTLLTQAAQHVEER